MRTKRQQIVFLIFLFFILPSPSPVSIPAPEETLSGPSWFPLLEKARNLAEKGAYQEARKIYESLLEKEGLGRRETSIRREYGALKMKLIFSRAETPESFFHTVEPGDTLSAIAKKYATTVTLLQRSNGLPSKDRIVAGQKLKVTRIQFSISIEKKANRLTLLADGEPLKTYRVATGEEGSTPPGSFKIVNKLENPTWFHAGVVIPPESPKNILGSRWLGFDLPGYGIHGTTLPQTIGTQASKGCVRMLNPDIEEIYDLVPQGTPVTVLE